MKREIVDCFCRDQPHSGNRAAVIINFKGDKKDQQEIAKASNLPVTVFISEVENAVPILEYFYPQTEAPLCLHGTIAAGQVLLNMRSEEKCRFITRLNGRQIEVFREQHFIHVKVARHLIPALEINIKTVYAMLNLLDPACLETSLPLTVSSVGSPKLLIPLKSSETLYSLQPNFSLILDWSMQNNINGIYVYAASPINNKSNSFIARGFNPKTGHQEDAATGVAAAALALFLKKSIVVEQGDCIGSPCSIIITYIHDDCILVGGLATVRKN